MTAHNSKYVRVIAEEFKWWSEYKDQTGQKIIEPNQELIKDHEKNDQNKCNKELELETHEWWTWWTELETCTVQKQNSHWNNTGLWDK